MAEKVTQVTQWPKPLPPTGIPQVYYDLSKERRAANGKLVKA
jgi:hypothetical protein